MTHATMLMGQPELLLSRFRETVLTQSMGTPSPSPAELEGLREVNIRANIVISWLYKEVPSCPHLAAGP